jgi:glycosyltransferase involved in cell wall biosynthesis
MLLQFAHLLVRRPLSAIRTAARAMFSEQRWRYFQSLSAVNFCLSRNVVHVHAHFADNNLRYAEIIAQWMGVGFGVTAHRYDITDDPIAAEEAIGIYSRAASIITISSFNRALMQEKYMIPASRINIVHCGIGLETFAFRELAVWPGHAVPRLVNVGRLVPEKGQDILLRAVAVLRDCAVPFELNIVGSGPLLNELQALAEELGIADAVHFLGTLDQAAVVGILRDADLFLLSSRIEGIPVACVEALAIGVPVIVTRTAGISELVEDGINGKLVERESPAELSAAIIQLLRDTSVVSGFQRAGRERVESSFERKKCTRDFIRAIGF